MRGGRPAGLTALLVLIGGPVTVGAAPPPPMPTDLALEAIDSCLKRLHPDIDIGYERVASRCPQLTRRLEESGWSQWLPRDWKRPGNDLSAGGLRQLRELLSIRSDAPRGGTRRPDVAGLPAALAGLTRANSIHRGWWPRAKEWLREVFERRALESDDDWLSRSISRDGLSQSIIELASYAALMLVVLLAGIIVLNEVRISGIPGRLRTNSRGTRVAGSPAAAEGDALSWDAVQAAPLTQRPGLLLEIIVAKLIRESRLPHLRALTVRELTSAARVTNEEDREGLIELARISERVRFSGGAVPNEALAAALDRGRMLLERVSPGASHERRS